MVKISSNLILGVIAIGGIALVIHQMRNAGKDLFGALPVLDEGIRTSIEDIKKSISGFQFSTFTLPSVFADTAVPSDPTQQTDEQQKDLFGETLTDEQEKEIVDIEKALENDTPAPATLNPDISSLRSFNPSGIIGYGFLGIDKKGISESLAKELGIFNSTTDDISEQQLFELSKIGTGIKDISTIFDMFPAREDILFSKAFELEIPKEEIIPANESTPIQETIPVHSQSTPQEVISSLPIEQEFQGFSSDPNTEFFIRENPIDTLAEVINAFPELTASQAADFLEATGGKILPSQIEAGLIDPNIKNIVTGFVGGGIGQAIPVSQTPLEINEIKESENQRAMEFTCKEYGLNCDLLE